MLMEEPNPTSIVRIGMVDVVYPNGLWLKSFG
jgi:hypothetical protein